MITGAGASYDCAVPRGHPLRGPSTAYRPPLTRELFQPLESFGPILDNYPGARAAAADIRVRLNSEDEADEAFALEKYLREELKESRNADARYRFRQIPLYLQHLLLEVSRLYTSDPKTTHAL